MVTVKPFCALRPREDVAHLIAALPYDVMNTEEAREVVRKTKGELSFLQIDKPELLGENHSVENQHHLAGMKLKQWMDEGILIQDENPAMYIYVLKSIQTLQYGLVCTLSCAEYDQGIIKKHEHTRSAKEIDRLKHIEACSAHTGPIFLMAKDMELLGKWMEEYCENHSPLYDFSSEEGVRHSIYKVGDHQVMKNVQMLFGDADALYIADGHHRCAAAAAYGRLYPESIEAQDFLGVVFPSEYLKIMDYNRVLKDKSDLKYTALMAALNNKFIVEQVEGNNYKPQIIHEFGMRYQKKWYKLKVRQEVLEGLSVEERLDVSLLQNLVLAPLFDIQDPRTDETIDFVGGIRGIEELNKRTDEDMDIAFSLYPTSLEDLMLIADGGGVMPPKSTWFEPKLLSGLLIHCI